MSNYEFWDELGKIFNAVVAYQEKSVEFNKRFIHPWIRLGNVFDQDDRNREAVNAYQKAIELDPGNAQNWYELGNVFFRMKSYDEAVGAYQKAVELDPAAGWAYSNLALTLVTQGKHVEAVPLYQKSIELIKDDKDRAVAWNRLGNVFRKLNEYELALQAFQKADELDGENAGFRDELDEVHEGPTLVDSNGVPAGEAASIPPVETITEMLAQQAEAPSVTEPVAVVEAPAPVEEPVAVQAEIPAEAAAPVVEEAQPEVEAPAAEAVTPDPEPAPVMEAPAEAPVEATVEVLAEDAAPLPAVEEPTPAWITETVEIVADNSGEAEVTFSIEDTQPITAARAEAAALAALGAIQESLEATSPAEETVAAAVPAESTETFTETIAEAPAEQTTVVVAIEQVAVVDPAQSYDEIVVTEDAPAEAVAEAAPAEEPAAVAAPESEVRAEAPAEEEPVEHAAYEEYLKDNTLVAPTAEEEAAPEAESATQEPVAKIDASGDVQIEMDSRNAHVWNELGNVYFNTGAFDDAIAAYTKAIELDRWFAWPYSNLALAYMQKGRFAEAILLYQRSIELFKNDKDKAISWNRLGNVYRRLNDYDNAIASYQRADELDPENATLSLQSRFSLLGTFSLENKATYAA